MTIKTLGIDIAKRVFQLHGVDKRGKTVLKKRIGRDQLLSFIANLPPCLIGMESCSGSNYWARQFQLYGHEVKLMSPQYVKPYVKTNKNDANDAEAICEAVARPNMRFVSIKTIEQQDIQSLHRYRQRVVQQRTALVNQIRGLLSEYGLVAPQGIGCLREKLPQFLENQNNLLTSLALEVFCQLHQDLLEIDKKVKLLDKRIAKICSENKACQRIKKIEGIGPLTATALVSAIGDISNFKNGRHLAAWLGLVPRQHSSGNKKVLLGISKRGDRYLRTLLIHGARAFISFAKRRSNWLEKLIERCGKQKAYVALANKNARIVWSLLAKQTEYHSIH
ncbi:IS110 family transposase [Candidatus Odyssella acanthamoebae]|uniref:Transposase n=1 Tax=Candidatus Odyssella acanthamoebae TaxID=91604 RepID=A0A077AUD4_9PROT|nr:IS110 family transposase [Candidatus Paracaedibacter acanthamoebae]AIK95625.1 transposase [Candidatus Paracaedibacter acanthamoebae]AIK95644.1 transposase [Candidatus Paracaedibacter acanthamoebae]AIK96243.1 transposase [Candidatus Paracaedibacter acanthamoebae]AIK96300.1 transposase [Candidatus Paracaedibacter acanthamoebae]AIK96577.1 transposase [Candidatus Paracaedibacter acanthamoebae]